VADSLLVLNASTSVHLVNMWSPPRQDLDHSETHVLGLRCWSGVPVAMGRPHRHNDIEVNLATSGSLEYVFAGSRMTLHAGSVELFWAAIPHQLLRACDGATVLCLNIPLDVVLACQLPERLVGPLLRGQHIRTTVLEELDVDSVRWQAELHGRFPELQVASILEVEAWLRRVAYRLDQGLVHETSPAENKRFAQSGTMAAFIASRFRDPIQGKDVAQTVHLNTQYAMALFRDTVGMTVNQYVTHCRLAEARRLLLTTDDSVHQIAFAAGFGSLSQFYAAFESVCHEPPGEYRKCRASLVEDVS
jgi:AraC-like DNA-binding protein